MPAQCGGRKPIVILNIHSEDALIHFRRGIHNKLTTQKLPAGGREFYIYLKGEIKTIKFKSYQDFASFCLRCSCSRLRLLCCARSLSRFHDLQNDLRHCHAHD